MGCWHSVHTTWYWRTSPRIRRRAPAVCAETKYCWLGSLSTACCLPPTLCHSKRQQCRRRRRIVFLRCRSHSEANCQRNLEPQETHLSRTPDSNIRTRFLFAAERLQSPG